MYLKTVNVLESYTSNYGDHIEVLSIGYSMKVQELQHFDFKPISQILVLFPPINSK